MQQDGAAQDLESAKRRLYDEAKRLESGPPAINPSDKLVAFETAGADLTEFAGAGLVDRVAHKNAQDQTRPYADDLATISELDAAIAQAHAQINELYSYRSVSKALPNINPKIESKEKVRVYKELWKTMSPEIAKIERLRVFHDSLIKIAVKNIRSLIQAISKKQTVWEDQVRKIVRIIDVIGQIDNIKQLNSALKNDLSHYRRVFHFIKNEIPDNGSAQTTNENMQTFLSNPSQPNHNVIYNLKREFISVGSQTEKIAVLNVLKNQILNDIRNGTYITPSEKHGLYRVLVTIIYLADTNETTSNGKPDKEKDAFRNRLLNTMGDIAPVLQKLPVVPLFADVPYSSPSMLQALCRTHFLPKYHDDFGLNLCSPQPRLHRPEFQDRYPDSYNLNLTLSSRREDHNLSKRYSNFATRYSALSLEVRQSMRRSDTNKQARLHLASKCWQHTRQGLKLLCEMSARLQEFYAWKCQHPLNDAEWKARCKEEGREEGEEYGTHESRMGGSTTFYERATMYNYSNQDKYALLEVLSLQKSLAQLMSNAESIMVPFLSLHAHHTIQRFLQDDLRFPLRRAYKDKKSKLEHFMKDMRKIAADVEDPSRMEMDYPQKKAKWEKVEDMIAGGKIPLRESFPAEAQIALLRRMIHWIIHRPKKGLFSNSHELLDQGSDQEKKWLQIYHTFDNYPEIVNYQKTIRASSDCWFLWYREYYLQVTRCVQFPIRMSLPWMMIDFALQTPSMMENIFVPLSVYNDCAERALTSFKQQYMFDEIEGEVNLAWDRLVYALQKKVFDHYKNVAAQLLLEKSLAETVKEARRRREPCVNNIKDTETARLSSILQQRNVILLGRQIDLQQQLVRYINGEIRENLDFILSRFEEYDITVLLEIESLLNTLRLAVELLRTHLPGIDDFEDVLREMNDDITIGSFKSRLVINCYTQIACNLLPNYSYNMTTGRFVNVQNTKDSRTWSYRNRSHLWGSRLTALYKAKFALTRQYFGVEHVKAMVHILPPADLPFIIEEAVELVMGWVLRDLSPYVETILDALNPCRLPKATLGVVAAYLAVDQMVKNIRHYLQQSDSEVFQLMRQIGNGLCFCQILEMVITNQNLLDQSEAFFAGFGQPRKHARGAVYQWSKQADDFRKPDRNPLIAIVQAAQNKLNAHAKMSPEEKAKHTNFVDFILKQKARREKFVQHNTGGWLFSTTLERLHKELKDNGWLDKWRGRRWKPITNVQSPETLRALKQQGCEDLAEKLKLLVDRGQGDPTTWYAISDKKLQKWKITVDDLERLKTAFETGPSNGVIDHEQPRDFARFWSVCRYLFLACDQSDPQRFEDPAQADVYYNSRMTKYGDGWAWCGHSILYLCSLEPQYRLFDFTNHLCRMFQIHDGEPGFDLSPTKQKKGVTMEKDKPFVRYLLKHAAVMEVKAADIMSKLRAHYKPPAIPHKLFSWDYAGKG